MYVKIEKPKKYCVTKRSVASRKKPMSLQELGFGKTSCFGRIPLQFVPLNTLEKEVDWYKRQLQDCDHLLRQQVELACSIRNMEELDKNTSWNGKTVIENTKSKRDAVTKKIVERNRHNKDIYESIKMRSAQADKWRNNASEQDKLYIGNGYQLNEHIKGKLGEKQDAAKKRVLDVEPDLWSEGVNEAWMKGGESKNTRFKLITHLPEELREWINGEARTGTAFLNKIEETSSLRQNRTLWNKERDEPTYFSQEVAHLLDNGYVLEVLPRKRGLNQFKQQFVVADRG